MCGIVGIVAGDNPVIDARALARMTAALVARGPDGEGYHIAPGIGLGHRRLAVIDVNGGAQPLHSRDGQCSVVVNGEIYNFRQLRAVLEKLGHTFGTACDAEVIVAGYQQWGDGILAHIEGMFALAVWDARRRRLLLARDRMGEKPLYWARLTAGGFAFASELKALRHAPGLDTALDPVALGRYLVHEYVPAPATILRNARKMEPGTQLVLETGAAPVLSTYWDLPLHSGPLITDGDEAARLLLEQLRTSVRQRLVADVPLGVFLSGGVDSSAVAALAAESCSGPLDTFTIAFDDPDFDESAEARFVAHVIGSRHHEEKLSADTLANTLPSVGALLDEPLGDASLVSTHLLARFARRHVTVCLGGDGGDELFAGYPTFIADKAAAWLDRTPGAIKQSLLAAARLATQALPARGGYLPLQFQLGQFLKGADRQGARRHQAWMASFLPDDARTVLALDVAAAAGSDFFDDGDRLWTRTEALSPGDRLLHQYARGYLAGDLLPKLDRATMAVGLEARSPLLAEGVVSLACRLSPSLRQRGVQTKFILKRALRDVLPARTLHRKKHGFALPLGAWFRGPLHAFLRDTLSARSLKSSGVFDVGQIQKLVDEHVSGRRDHRKPLWTVLAFILWQDDWRRA